MRNMKNATPKERVELVEIEDKYQKYQLTPKKAQSDSAQ